eukprot:scaffold101_cov373-Prasinococcus_capsulatus_cf.AAC.19
MACDNAPFDTIVAASALPSSHAAGGAADKARRRTGPWPWMGPRINSRHRCTLNRARYVQGPHTMSSPWRRASTQPARAPPCTAAARSPSRAYTLADKLHRYTKSRRQGKLLP